MDRLDIYEILVAGQQGMLHAYVSGIVNDPFLAEDICQEAFVQGFQQLHTLKDKGSFPVWLRVIARNIAFAELKRRRLEVPTDPEIIQGMEDIFGALETDTGSRTWDERLHAVADCVARLPVKLQECCSLFYFDGKTVKEVATELNTSLAAVLKRLERARALVGDCVSRQLRLERV